MAMAWLLPRHIAGARRAAVTVLLLDAAPLALGAILLSLAAGRPVFAGLVVLALGAGFALADHTMRLTLREPVVFSESVELALILAGAWLLAREPLLGKTADAVRRLRPSGEPFADAAALGPFAMLLV